MKEMQIKTTQEYCIQPAKKKKKIATPRVSVGLKTVPVVHSW